jgi:hypothetical protein
MATKRETLAEQTDRRLREAGLADDPALVALRAWNRDAYAIAAGSVLATRDRANGKQR